MITEGSDCWVLLNYLTKKRRITEYCALHRLGIKRLSARVRDLKDNGYNIVTIKKKIKKHNGRLTNVTDYYMLIN